LWIRSDASRSPRRIPRASARTGSAPGWFGRTCEPPYANGKHGIDTALKDVYAHIWSKGGTLSIAMANPPILPCACANLRRAARAVTRLYDQELRGSGLNPTQFTLLMVLEIVGDVTQGELGRMLALDSTTLTRTLKLLLTRGSIRAVQRDDRRERHLSLTPSGRHRLHRAQPNWERAQKR
jgi:DNA-binding MarR family transcriptional regulator